MRQNDVSTAPKDGTKILTFSRCGKYIITSWLSESARWNGYAKGENPICWWALPEVQEAGDLV